MSPVPESPKILNLLVASPGDVQSERDAVERVCARVSKRRSALAIKCHRWEDAPPTQGGDAQGELERHIPEFEALDIVVVICWTRYGTRLASGLSGTDHEFTRAHQARANAIMDKRPVRPEILAYNCTAGAVPGQLDAAQLLDIQDFVKKVQKSGLLKTYSDRSQFETMFEDHLEKLIGSIYSEARPVQVGSVTAISKRNEELLPRIIDAAERLRGHIYRTPLVRSKRLEQDLNCKRVMLKLESVQVTGSFKIRGAMNAVRIHERDKSIIAFATASAGNHGLGLAYSAAQIGKEAFVYMPQRTPLTKRRAIERWTSNITLIGATFEETKEYAQKEAATNGYMFIHPYNDIDVIAGQGTLGVELVADIKEQFRGEPPDIVVIPAGGGGLLAGVATALKREWPSTRIFAAEAANVPSLMAALRDGKPTRVNGKRTFADGIAVAEVGDVAFAVLRGLVDGVWTVSEESMARSVVRLADDLRVIAEGAGACALGAVFDKYTSDAALISNKSVLVIVSGGNLDTVALTKLLQRGLVTSQRLAHLRFVADDIPGELGRITGDLGDLQINILDLWHSRLDAFVRVGAAHVHVIAEARDASHVESIVEALVKRGHDVRVVTE